MGIATARDDEDVRALLRESAFPGAVKLSFEREPDILARHVEGDLLDLIVARERSSGRAAGVASRSSRQRYVNGMPMRVGYLGQLRIATGFARSRELLDQGFRFCRSLHERDRAPIYLASVVGDNTPARRLLERGTPGWPAFRPVDELVTLAIPARGGLRRSSPRMTILSAGSIPARELAAVLGRNNARYQFAPCWTAQELISQPGLQPSDFVIASRNGRIVACAGVWDQRAFKQVVVRGYSRSLEWCRPLINIIGPLVGIPVLPPVGSQLAFAHLSHVAVDDDDPDTMIALVAAARRAARARGLDYITAGMSSRSPFLGPLRRRFANRQYSSVLYVAAWPDGESVADALDGRPSHPEIAIL